MMVTSRAVALETRPATRAGFPERSLRFDSIAVALGGWLVGGIYLDGWAHHHRAGVETFFTPWHAVLYSGFLALFAFLVLAAARNRARGHGWQRTLPRGYGLSLVGGGIFLAGAVLDLLWHQLFGVEANTEALLSPTHLLLGFGAALLATGPLRTLPGGVTAGRRGWSGDRGRWLVALPLLLASTYVLALGGFFTQFAHPLVEPWAASASVEPPVKGQLYTMRADGTAQTRLTLDPREIAIHPTWSPDGRRIAYTSADGVVAQIVVVNADGSGRVRLTSGPGNNYTPAWSPDGRRIAFASSRDGKGEVYVMDADGGNQVRLTTTGGDDITPRWSPDGRRIAFTSSRDGLPAIYAMDADGGNQVRLTDMRAWSHTPSWSPDGKRLAFVSLRDGHAEIYTMASDGGDQRRLTFGSVGSWLPAWSPHGRTVAFVSEREGSAQVYTMDAAGGNITNISKTPGMDVVQLLAWSPDGAQLAYTLQPQRNEAADLGIDLGLAGFLLQAALALGVALFALRHWSLPFGGLTLVFALSGLLIATQQDQFRLVPAAALVGLVADLLLHGLRPGTARPQALALFAFVVPATYVALNLATLALTGGVGWSVHLWAGAAVMAGFAGLLLNGLGASVPLPNDS